MPAILQPTSLKEVVERTAAALGVSFDEICEITADRIGQDSRYWLDSSKIESTLGWKQLIDWDTGLSEMVQWGTTFANQIKNYSTDYVLRG